MAVLDFRNGGYDPTHPSHDPRGYAQDRYDDRDYAGYRAAYAQSATRPLPVNGRLGRLLNYLGAVVSVGVILFIVVWGYKLVMRDVSGVPVIRAIEGEARIAPDDPGGEASRYTGLGVNAVAGGGSAQAPDQVAIAPAPTGLEADDGAMGDYGVTSADTIAVGDMPVNEAVTEVASMSDLGGIDPEGVHETSQEEAFANATQEAMAALNAGVADGPRPRPRPASIRAAAVDAAAPVVDVPSVAADTVAAPADPVAPTVETSAETPVQTAPNSPYMAQIGALDSEANAKSHWSRVAGKFPSQFSGKSLILQNATTGGRKFVRVRVGGFASAAEARAFCGELVAGGVDCIPASAK